MPNTVFANPTPFAREQVRGHEGLALGTRLAGRSVGPSCGSFVPVDARPALADQGLERLAPPPIAGEQDTELPVDLHERAGDVLAPGELDAPPLTEALLRVEPGRDLPPIRLHLGRDPPEERVARRVRPVLRAVDQPPQRLTREHELPLPARPAERIEAVGEDLP